MADKIVAGAGAGIGIVTVGVEQLVYNQSLASGTGNPTQTFPTIKAINYGVSALTTIVGAAGVMGKGPLRNHPSAASGSVGFGIGQALATFLWNV